MRVSYVVFLTIFQIVQIKSDSSIDEYLKQTINNFRELMPIGDPDLHIPILDPYHIKDVDSQIKNNKAELSLKFQNLVLTGASKFELKTLTVDLASLVMKVFVVLPELIIKGNYDVNGKVMKIFPVYGKGEVVTGVRNFEINATLGINIDSQTGKLTFSSFDMKLDFSEAVLNLENILGGGSLGDLVNQFANLLARPIFEKNKIGIETDIKTEVLKMLDKELNKIDIRTIINRISLRSSYDAISLPDVDSINKYVDLLLENSKTNPDMNIDPILIENQSQKSSGVKIDIKNGRIYGLKSVHRVGNFVLHCDPATAKCLFNGELGVDNIQAKFDTRMRWHFIKISPSIDCKVNSIRVKFAFHLNIQGRRGEAAIMQSFEISQFSTPDIKVGHLGPLGKVLSFLMKLIGPLLKSKIKNSVENQMKNAVVKALQKVTFEF